jgi:hypothetical protein
MALDHEIESYIFSGNPASRGILWGPSPRYSAPSSNLHFHGSYALAGRLIFQADTSSCFAGTSPPSKAILPLTSSSKLQHWMW